MRLTPTRLVATLAAAVLALGLAGCGSSSNPLSPASTTAAADNTIVVGSADFTENVLLAEIYASALRGVGLKASTKPRVGTRETLVKGLQDKSLGVVPEYTGNLLAYLDKSTTATKPDEVYSALTGKVPAGLKVLKASKAEDSDVLVVTQQTAQQNNLRTLEDLGPKCGNFVLGAAGEWKQRWETKIKDLYGCTFKQIQTTDAGGPVTVEALKNGTVQVANLFTTASAITANKFVQLEDTKRMYPAQQVVPFGRGDVLTQQASEVLDRVSDALNTQNLTALVARVEVDKENAADVASDFLRDSSLPRA
jgi:osmoprotectant transport system substrate-binding protein